MRFSQDEYNQYYKEWTLYIDQYRDTIDLLISQLQERYNDIFTPREITLSLIARRIH